MMNITYMVNNINQIGGVEKVVCGLGSEFVNRYGWTVHIISLTTADSHIYFPISENVKIIHKAYPVEIMSDKRMLLKAIKDILINLKSDIFITTCSDLSVASILNKRFFKGKLVVTEHADYSFYSKSRKILNHLAFPFADYTVFLTENNKKIYRRTGVCKSTVIPNPIFDRSNCLSSLQAKSIVAVGRLTRVKGFDLLLEAFAIVHQSYPAWKLRILGDGEERKSLINQAAALGIDDFVTLPGYKKNIYEEISCSSIFVLSSRSEAFALVLMEAMECGLAISAPDLPCVVEMMDGKCGCIYECENIQSMAQSVMRLISSEEERLHAGQESRARAGYYALDNICLQWKQLFERLLMK